MLEANRGQSSARAMGRAQRWIAAGLGLALTFGTMDAEAFELVNDEELKLDIFGWGQAGWEVHSDPVSGDVTHGPYLGLARLGGSAAYSPWGRGVIQIEGVSGDVQLLDLVAELTPLDWLTLRGGKFKVPTSADFLIRAPSTPFVNRAYLVDQGFVKKRLLGAEIIGKLDAEPIGPSLQIGWFQPDEAERTALGSSNPGYFSARALFTLPRGLSVHVAYLDLVGDDLPAAVPGDPSPIERRIDAALIYADDGWTAYLEGLASLDDVSSPPVAAYLMVLKNFDLSADDDLSLEPGLRYDVARRDPSTIEQRVTAGMTLYFVGDYLNTSLNYELRAVASDLGHTGYAQVQFGF